MIRRLVWSFCGALGMLACTDNAAPAPPPTFALTPARQWSGGTVQLRSASFHPPAALPVVTSGTDTLALARVDDSTLSVTLPTGPSGTVALVAHAEGSQYELGNVQRYGLSTRSTIGTDLTADLLTAYLPGGPTVLGVPWSKYNLRTVNLRSGQILNYDLLFPPFYGAASSDEPGRFALVDSAYHGGLWELLGENTAVLREPWDGGGTFFGYEAVSPVTRVSDSVWVECAAFYGDLYVFVGHPPVQHLYVNEGCSRRMTYQTGNSWVLMVERGQLLSTQSGDITHSFGYGWFAVATSSTNGRLIYAIRATDDADTLMAIDAGTQQTLQATVLAPGTAPRVLAADPAGDRVYLLAVGADSLLTLDVFSDSTLTPLGVLPLGEKCPANIDCSGSAIAVDLNFGRIDVVAPSGFSAPGVIPSPRWRFDRLP